MHMSQIPETGFLRLTQILGEEGVTEDQAAANRDYNKQAEAEAIKKGRLNRSGKPVYARRRTKARPPTPAIIPVKKTSWWEGVKSGRFPQPVKLGPRTTAWRVEDIRNLIAEA